MKITHPIKGYTGVANVGRRFWFVEGECEATHIKPSHRAALEEAGFAVVNPRSETRDDSRDDSQASGE